ncbi:hypothetical protein BLOT_014711 [Blomia tropicalis]|nr:hypothetical protein BLOT_014711 [Blomia tropicalis]
MSSCSYGLCGTYDNVQNDCRRVDVQQFGLFDSDNDTFTINDLEPFTNYTISIELDNFYLSMSRASYQHSLAAHLAFVLPTDEMYRHLYSENFIFRTAESRTDTSNFTSTTEPFYLPIQDIYLTQTQKNRLLVFTIITLIAMFSVVAMVVYVALRRYKPKEKTMENGSLEFPIELVPMVVYHFPSRLTSATLVLGNHHHNHRHHTQTQYLSSNLSTSSSSVISHSRSNSNHSQNNQNRL